MGNLILGANTASTGDLITNSLRFNNDDSPNLTFTPSSAGDRDVWTWSAWIKVNGITGTYPLFTAGAGNGGGWSSGGTGTGIILYNDQLLTYWNSPSSPTYSANLIRDPSAWYHVVLQANDTTLKVYVNSVERSSKSISGDGEINNTNAQSIGRYSNNTDAYFDGHMAEIHFVDGSALAPTEFAEFNSNGVWIPKEYDGSYGSNGFYLQFKQTGTSANASGMGADTSGNGNHFTPAGLAAIDVTTDTPHNIFAVMNPLTHSEPGNQPTFAEGNLKITMTNFDTESVMATIGVEQGKWYWEIKGGWKTSNWGFGIEKSSSSNTGFNVGYTSTSYSFSQSGYKQNNSSATQIDSGLSDGDIIGYALDLDNGYFNFSQNGVWYNGSASESTTFDTGNHDFSSLDFGSEIVMPTISAFGDGAITTEINFGQPTFSISSGNSDANGYGNFEYAPPSGYYALCTKNLSEFG